MVKLAIVSHSVSDIDLFNRNFLTDLVGCNSGPVHTYPDIFESVTFFFPDTVPSTRIRRIRQRIRIFLLLVDGGIFESGKKKLRIQIKNIRRRVDGASVGFLFFLTDNVEFHSSCLAHGCIYYATSSFGQRLIINRGVSPNKHSIHRTNIDTLKT